MLTTIFITALILSIWQPPALTARAKYKARQLNEAYFTQI